jgi:hypothetical protein
VNEPDANWHFNYFNYFTEVEEHFQRARGTGMFLLSPLDWSLIEIWKDSGVPLEAVLRGIDAAFEKWRSRKSKVRMINSLAYCSQAVLEQAQRMAGTAPAPAARAAAPPFELDDLRRFLAKCAAQLRSTGDTAYGEIAISLNQLAAQAEDRYTDLEDLELRLSALEEKMVAVARSRQTEQEAFAARQALALELRPYRSKMSAAQLAMLEQQYLDRRLLDTARLPRLSLFYLR